MISNRALKMDWCFTVVRKKTPGKGCKIFPFFVIPCPLTVSTKSKHLLILILCRGKTEIQEKNLPGNSVWVTSTHLKFMSDSDWNL